MNQQSKIFLWAFSATLGGFLFGFDIAAISGVEQTLQKLWNLSVFELGVTVSITLAGTILGSLIGGIPAEKYGRKFTLIIVAVLYLLATFGTAVALEWTTFLIFRFLGGLGVGVSSVIAPMYISEIAPPAKRGRLVAMFQLNIILGILMAYLSNYLLIDIGINSWRWMLGLKAFPAVIFLITAIIIPESPRWLILKKGNVLMAYKTLKIIDSLSAEQVIHAIQKQANQCKKQNFTLLFKVAYRKPVLLAVLFAVFNQVSGINAIIYFAHSIFEVAGLGKASALLSSAGIELINLISTLLGISLIDKFGRKVLMSYGSIGLIVSLSLIAQAFFSGNMGIYVSFYLFFYIAFFGFSQGAVIWVFISEILPNEVRAYGQALSSFTNWILVTIITFYFPYLIETFGGGITFSFFALMMLLQLFFVWRFMPETKGTSLEGNEKALELL
jgi:SP family arabinose:H+ symporter-like MFS transporter